MNKTIFFILSLIFLIITSCEEDPNTTDKNGSITIESPYEDYEFIYTGQSLEIIAKINHKDEASSAYISINNDIIASGLSDTLIAYYEPNSNINQNAVIEATLVDEQNQIISSDNINISINTIDSNTLNSESVFMNINNEFMMMRNPVTNRQFLNFLNTNQQLNVDLVNILWTDVDTDGYGDPNQCEFDESDNYEPTNWWYVNVTSNYANENVPAGEYTVYKNATNIYDSNSDYSDEAGKIQYDCQTENFYLPNEEDGTESIYLDHPVVGVSWIGANIYANYFGWSLPTMEEWILAAKGSINDVTYDWIYPWNDSVINQNYANYDNDNTSQVQYYNGLEDLNLSLSAYGLYDMAGNVWEYTSTLSGTDAYKKTGGAFDSEENQLEIGYVGYALWEHVSYNTGFRCITDIDYISSPPSGCMNQEACNYDMFAESSSDCFEDDCLNLCGGITQEFEFFQDSDFDGFGNPNISEFQCDVAELGWADNSNDLDDECFSNNIEQNNIDCNNICDGTAYYDGCNQCVGGETGIEPCAEDCNGDEGGTAEWDDCGICSGGNTEHEANSDMDCNGDCASYTPVGCEGENCGNAFLDQCNVCSGGNTEHEANSDMDDCETCFGAGSQLYCIDNNENGCCDCGNDDNGNWDECNANADSELLCENEVENFHIETILGCSNSNAENYYCELESNECFELVANVIIPPCNFIDDGSCIVYGCSDEMASNYNDEATICQDGSANNCCEYITPLAVSFGNVDTQNGTMEILITIPEYDSVSDYVYGFQFNIDGVTLSSASGGLAEENDFSVSKGSNIIIGFSLTGSYISQGTGILTIVEFTPTSNEACFSLGTGAFSNQNSQPIPTEFGDCYEF